MALDLLVDVQAPVVVTGAMCHATFGDPGTVPSINYLDIDVQPQQVFDVPCHEH